MKSVILFIILLIALAFDGFAITSSYSITLTEDLKLKALFDAGIRPRQVRALNYCRCEFKADSSELIFGGRKFITRNGECEVDILAGDIVRLIVFYERNNMTVDEAASRMKEYCSILGVSDSSIDQQFKSFRENPIYGKPFDISAKYLEWNIGIEARNTYSKEKPVWFIFQACRHFKNQKEPKEREMNQPLQAPVGYEQYTMDPEPLGQDPKGPPILTPQELADKMRKELDEKRKLQGLSTSQSFAKPTLLAIPPTQQKDIQSKTLQPMPWPWIIGAVILSITCGVYLKYKHR